MKKTKSQRWMESRQGGPPLGEVRCKGQEHQVSGESWGGGREGLWLERTREEEAETRAQIREERIFRVGDTEYVYVSRER